MIGLIVMGGFSYYIYNIMFASNTAFNQEIKYIYIRTGSDYNDLIQELRKHLKDPSSFSVLAKRKKEYKDIGYQLDLLYHDMTAGKLDGTGEWHKHIKAVKDANTKG